mgnify:CR=1 FL=1
MIRHIALFRLKAEAPAGTLKALEDELFQLAQKIPEIERYDYGSDLGLREGNFDFGVVADFETAEAFKAYATHPDHLAFIERALVPVLDERVSIQFEI